MDSFRNIVYDTDIPLPDIDHAQFDLESTVRWDLLAYNQSTPLDIDVSVPDVATGRVLGFTIAKELGSERSCEKELRSKSPIISIRLDGNQVVFSEDSDQSNHTLSVNICLTSNTPNEYQLNFQKAIKSVTDKIDEAKKK